MRALGSHCRARQKPAVDTPDVALRGAQAEKSLVKLTERIAGAAPRSAAGNPFLAAPEEEDAAQPRGAPAQG